MFKSSMSTSPKPSNGFLSKICRNMHISSTHASASTKTPRSTSRNTRDLSSPSSSSSSNLSSPVSNTRRTPQERRHAALFSKITFSTPEFIEDRYVYSSSLDQSLPSHVLHYNCVESGPYFAIPSSKEAYIQRLDQLFFEGKSCHAGPHELNPSFSPELPRAPFPLRTAFQEVFEFPAIDVLEDEPQLHDEAASGSIIAEPKEPIQDLLSAICTSLRSDPTEFSPSIFNWDAETFEDNTSGIELEVDSDSRAVPGLATKADRYPPSFVAWDPSLVRAKPSLSRQGRVASWFGAKAAPTSSSIPYSLPDTRFTLLPEDCIGMAL